MIAGSKVMVQTGDVEYRKQQNKDCSVYPDDVCPPLPTHDCRRQHYRSTRAWTGWRTRPRCETPTVRGKPPRLKYRQRRSRQQHQQTASGVDQFGKEIGIRERRFGRSLRHPTHILHVPQQDSDRNDCQKEFDRDPPMPKQSPPGTERLDKAAEQRGETERNDDEPTDQFHREVSGARRLRVTASKTGSSQGEVSDDRAKPAG